MKEGRFPALDKLSTLTAAVMLAFALARYIDLPARRLQMSMGGIYWEVVINTQTTVAVLAAAMTAMGTDWLLRDHPTLRGGMTVPHWVLPSLTALVFGVVSHQLPFGIFWGEVMVIGAVILSLVLVAEYVVVDGEDARYPLALAVLTALSFGLFLVLAVTLRANGVRLMFVLPSLSAAAALVSLRSVYLRHRFRSSYAPEGTNFVFFAGLSGLVVVGQLIIPLHYLPLSPLKFGLILLAFAYTLSGFLGNLTEGRSVRGAVVGPLIVFSVILGFARWWV